MGFITSLLCHSALALAFSARVLPASILSVTGQPEAATVKYPIWRGTNRGRRGDEPEVAFLADSVRSLHDAPQPVSS